ncbi:MarR family winged helix-turn-helix transcriptional regulator [Ornithinicoccus hortensis]|uniref:MarR family transcriptional regulator n=1 Tax=Ornithinicoccus hortensis TaxID=82346 RepID=A0A542YVV1_9MICO|nr:MarR family transcriptional regulator [Ornithinicoccus hortensis]TQL52192.1 MarR family transcriptional regulator [Ornithinicoccus hortensis]
MARAADQEGRWLSEDEQRSWRAFLRGQRLLNEALDQALATDGIRLTEYEIISMLSEAPGGRLRMSVLADQVVQSRSRLTHTATRLESRGWVERRTCHEDRRGVELTLTASGRAALVDLSRIHVESVRANLVDLLEPEQFAALGEAMQVVVDALDVAGLTDAAQNPVRTHAAARLSDSA